MHFSLKITLGNVLMRNATQVKDALHRVGQQLDSSHIVEVKRGLSHTHAILDINDNKVGEWELSPDT